MAGTKGIDGLVDREGKITSRPTAAPRAMNEGTPYSQVGRANAEFKLSTWTEKSAVDRAILNTLQGEARAERRFTEDVQINQAIGTDFESEIFYGDVSVDPNGFDGLQKGCANLNAVVDSDAPIVLSASGTGSDLSSIYFIDLDSDFRILYNNQAGAVSTMEDLGTQLVVDSGGTNTFSAEVTEFNWIAGMRYSNLGVGRIANIEDGASKTITTALFSQMRNYMRNAGRLVAFTNPYIMHRIDNIATGSIQYTSTDTGLAKPISTVYDIPVFVTDSLTKTESAAT